MNLTVLPLSLRKVHSVDRSDATGTRVLHTLVFTGIKGKSLRFHWRVSLTTYSLLAQNIQVHLLYEEPFDFVSRQVCLKNLFYNRAKMVYDFMG